MKIAFCLFVHLSANPFLLRAFLFAKKSGEQHKKQLKTVGDIGTQIFEGYSNDGQDLENRSHTGFSQLDEILKGMSAGSLIILAARPKVGKTAFALSIAENVAKSGKAVAFYSLEMESSEIYERLLSKRSKIPMNTLIERGARAGDVALRFCSNN